MHPSRNFWLRFLLFSFALRGGLITNGFKIIHPKAEDILFTEDLVLGMDFFPSVEPSYEYFLFIRFDGDHNITGQDSIFSSFGASHGLLGSAVDSVFTHAFNMVPGTHSIEARLGFSWDKPVSSTTIDWVQFTVISGCEQGNNSLMVIDAFPFFNELDLLEVRLLELWDVVDIFVLVESISTHSGLDKDLVFSSVAQSPRFSHFSSKIKVVVDRYDDLVFAATDNKLLSREEHQRDMISIAIDELGVPSDSLVLISDVDEVPRQTALRQLRRCWSHAVKPTRLLMDWYIYSTQWLSPRPWGVFAMEGPLAVTPSMLHQIRPSQWRRALRVDVARQMQGISIANALSQFGTLGGAGWHFSSFGGPLAVKEKLRSYIGADLFGDPVYGDVDRLERLVRGGVPYFELATVSSLDTPVRAMGRPRRGPACTFLHIPAGAPFEQTQNNDLGWEESLPTAVIETRQRLRSLSSFVKTEEDNAELTRGLLGQDVLKARVALGDSGGFIMAAHFGDNSEESKQFSSKMTVDCWGDIAEEVNTHCLENLYSPGACDGLHENVQNECVLGKRGRRYYSNTFVVDTARRFEIVPPGMSEVHVIEVWPWSDIGEVVALEGKELKLDPDQVLQLEAYLRQGLQHDEVFLHYKERFSSV